MNTLDSYTEQGPPRSGWKWWVGTVISFIGFVLITNAFFAFMQFRQIIPFWAEIAFAIAGGIVGTLGLMMRGNRGNDLSQPIFLMIGGVIALIFVNFISGRFGIVGLLVVIALFYLWEKKFGGMVED